MKAKIKIGLVASLIVSMILTTTVFAGASIDYGNIPGTPPPGQANWIGWNDTSYYGNPYPAMVMTEDATNSSLGPDQGYSPFLGMPRWVMIPENLEPAPVNNVSWITVILGGLGSYNGNLWISHFRWTNTSSMTDHGAASVLAGTAPCPSIVSSSASPVVDTFTWTGPAGDYYVYRSQNGSGSEPNNGLSGGVYYYLDKVVGTTGAATYNDFTGGGFENWYIVVHANSATGAIDGCHSEEAHPTAVDVVGFVAVARSAHAVVDIAWDSTTEVGLAGFNVFRAPKSGGVKELVNSAIIAPQNPGSAMGSHYSLIDSGVKSGQAYDYWVEVLETGSEPALYGPQEVTPLYGYFMPMILH